MNTISIIAVILSAIAAILSALGALIITGYMRRQAVANEKVAEEVRRQTQEAMIANTQTVRY